MAPKHSPPAPKPMARGTRGTGDEKPNPLRPVAQLDEWPVAKPIWYPHLGGILDEWPVAKPIQYLSLGGITYRIRSPVRTHT